MKAGSARCSSARSYRRSTASRMSTQRPSTCRHREYGPRSRGCPRWPRPCQSTQPGPGRASRSSRGTQARGAGRGHPCRPSHRRCGRRLCTDPHNLMTCSLRRSFANIASFDGAIGFITTKRSLAAPVATGLRGFLTPPMRYASPAGGLSRSLGVMMPSSSSSSRPLSVMRMASSDARRFPFAGEKNSTASYQVASRATKATRRPS